MVMAGRYCIICYTFCQDPRDQKIRSSPIDTYVKYACAAVRSIGDVSTQSTFEITHSITLSNVARTDAAKYFGCKCATYKI